MQQILPTLSLIFTLSACGIVSTSDRQKPQPRGIPFEVVITPEYAAGGQPVALFGQGGAFEIIDQIWPVARKASKRLGTAPVEVFWRQIDTYELLAFSVRQQSAPLIGLLEDNTVTAETLDEIRAAIPAVTACEVGYIQPRDVPGVSSGIYVAFLECDYPRPLQRQQPQN